MKPTVDAQIGATSLMTTMPATLKRRIKNLSKKWMRTGFAVGQQFGVDLLPRHFYSEIPDLRLLRQSERWKTRRSMNGIRGEIDDQVVWVDQCTSRFREQLKEFQIHKAAVSMNGSDEGYGEVEADFLYCVIRSVRPSRIVQIGCGVSTAVCLMAAKDEGYSPRIICIEPYPTEFLKRESKAGSIELVTKKVEDTELDFLRSLEANDLFFVDSSHTLAPAGEVNLLILEALPKISPGVYVHFHDIYFPFDYSPDTLTSALFFWHETALLYAFLAMNPHFEIAASLSMLHHQRLPDLMRFFPAMKPRKFEHGLSIGEGQYPSSIFLRRNGASQPAGPGAAL